MTRKRVQQSTWWQSVRVPLIAMGMVLCCCILFLMLLAVLVAVVRFLVG